MYFPRLFVESISLPIRVLRLTNKARKSFVCSSYYSFSLVYLFAGFKTLTMSLAIMITWRWRSRLYIIFMYCFCWFLNLDLGHGMMFGRSVKVIIRSMLILLACFARKNGLLIVRFDHLLAYAFLLASLRLPDILTSLRILSSYHIKY